MISRSCSLAARRNSCVRQDHISTGKNNNFCEEEQPPLTSVKVSLQQYGLLHRICSAIIHIEKARFDCHIFLLRPGPALHESPSDDHSRSLGKRSIDHLTFSERHCVSGLACRLNPFENTTLWFWSVAALRTPGHAGNSQHNANTEICMSQTALLKCLRHPSSLTLQCLSFDEPDSESTLVLSFRTGDFFAPSRLQLAPQALKL
jgi:hypothetical protein